MDWYISPADRFTYETQFSTYSPDDSQITLPQLDPIFHLSRLETAEFLVRKINTANMASS
jgi:hypothetical protein